MFILYICGTLRKQFSRKIKFNVSYADTFTNTKIYNISCLLLILIIIKNISLIWRAKNLNSIQAYPIFIHQILYWIFFYDGGKVDFSSFNHHYSQSQMFLICL